MTDISALAALFLFLSLIGFVVMRFIFRAPYHMHQEQEKVIEEQRRELDTRAALLSRCNKFTELIEEGDKIHEKCRAGNFPGKAIHEWFNTFEKYLRTLDPMYLNEWKNERDINLRNDPTFRMITGPDHLLYMRFLYRLIRSQMMLNRWRELAEQNGLVPRETNSTSA